MIEVIWHGRGGQGAFTAARLLGATASLTEGLFSLAFPSFGPERRGAPIRAFTKIDTSAIGNRSEVRKADYVVYLDETLFGENWKDELKENGKVLLNTKQNLDDVKVISIDASGIAEEVLGRDIPNTVFVALLSKLSDTLSLNETREAVQNYMPEKLVSKNLQVVDYVDTLGTFEQLPVNSQHLGDSDFSSSQAHPSGDKKIENVKFRASQAHPLSEEKLEESRLDEPLGRATANASESDLGCAKSRIGRRGRIRGARNLDPLQVPTLHDTTPKPEEFSHNTCWEAGFLTTKNCGWRTLRPVVDVEKCTGCLKCYMDCPDGCVFKVDEKNVGIDYDFCKGCGICSKSCKFGAIEMTPERGE